MTQPGTLGSQVPAGEDATVRKIADLERALRELGPSIAASFATTVAALQQAQADLAAQALNQVVPAVGSDSSSGFILTTTAANYANFTITVPSGYTRALVFAGGTLSGTTATSGGDVLYVKVGVNGSYGAESASAIPPGDVTGTASGFRAISLSSLSGSISVQISGRLLTGPGMSVASYVNVAAQVIFLH